MEAHFLSAIDHENIIKVKDFGHENGLLYMVMDYVDGLDLEAITDEKGEAELAPLRAGSWQLIVKRPGYATYRKKLKVPASDRRERITVRDHKIELQPGGLVEGIVRDADGQRVHGATVKVGEVTAKTDANGKFKLVDLPAGELKLEASKGEAKGTKSVKLSAGEKLYSVDVDFSR